MVVGSFGLRMGDVVVDFPKISLGVINLTDNDLTLDRTLLDAPPQILRTDTTSTCPTTLNSKYPDGTPPSLIDNQ